MQPRQQGRQASSRECQLAQLAVQVLRSLVELGPLVHDVAEHLLFDLVERQCRGQGKQRQSVRIGDAPCLG